MFETGFDFFETNFVQNQFLITLCWETQVDPNIFVVVLMPDGIYGWITKGGLSSMLAAFGITKRSKTYPRIDVDEQINLEPKTITQK